MRTIRITAVLDDSGEVRISVPADFRAGETVDVEVSLRDQPNVDRATRKSRPQLLDTVSGIFEDAPLELPDDPPPGPIDFEE